MDDDTYRRARIRAAERGASVSAMVRAYLTEMTSGETEVERLKRVETALRDSIDGFRAGDRLSRDDAHVRRSP
ncbi:MAG TPA: hypothetical protein VIB82_03345 [Caulobacteraceae bacterium]